MQDFDNRDEWYCLYIAIVMGLDPREAALLYEYGPDFPQCQEILKKRAYLASINRPKSREEERKLINELQKQGYSIEDIAEALNRDCSTIRRVIQRLKNKQ